MGKKSRQKRQKNNLPKPGKLTVEQQILPTETALGSRLAQASSLQVGSVRKGTQMDDYSHVRSEVKRILVFLGLIVVVLSSAVILNTRSSVLRNLGGDISSFLRLQ